MNIVILDRDGVINRDSSEYIKSVDEWQPLPGSLNAIAQLSKAGYRVFVATNQSGLARQLFSTKDLDAIHQKMCVAVAEHGGSIEKIFYCPHHPDEACGCRKPATGMLDQLEAYLGRTVANAFLVGDSRKDLELALAKHCRPVLVRTGNGRHTETTLPDGDIKVVDNLAAASQWILQAAKP